MLDETDAIAEADRVRYSGREVFGTVRRNLDESEFLIHLYY